MSGTKRHAGRDAMGLGLLVALAAAALVAACEGGGADASSCSVRASQTFRDRIEPLLVDDRVTTCNQCHLSGVDLKAFARETPCKTLACLVDQGLVDLSDPEGSRILSWIERASPDSTLTADVVAAERSAFLDWIEANAACPDACAGVACGEPNEGPTCRSAIPDPAEPSADAPLRCSDIEIEQTFMSEVYAWRGRCFPCHFDTELKADAEAPRWLSAKGNCETASITSLRRALERGLIDVAEPKQSLLLLKPLDMAAGGLKHGGGEKFSGTEDLAYAAFLRFIEYYANCSKR